MKRIRKVLFILSMIVFTTLQVGNSSVYGDEAEDEDKFYKEHSAEFEIEERNYLANGEDGYVNIYQIPGSETVFYEVENDSVAYVMYRYKDDNGDEWGIVYVDKEEHPKIKEQWGWIKLSECRLKYDAILFNQNHSSEFVKEKTEFDISKQTETVYLWTFPGSGEVQTEIDPSTDYSKEYKKVFDTYYSGQDGEKWVYVSNYKGMKGWICITNATTKDIKVIDYYAPEKKQDGNSSKVIRNIIVGIGLAVILILLGIFIFLKVRRNKKRTNVR